MYDRDTADLIRAIPPVGELDPGRLPELLTQCYSEISSVRLRIARGSEQAAAALEQPLELLRQLASSLEIYAALAADAENRDSAAFVSATAHRLLAHAWSIVLPVEQRVVGLQRNSIPSELSAGLLFLAAGYPADARESVLGVRVQEDLRAAVLSALFDLCRGDLQAAAGRDFSVPEDLPRDERAEYLLWKEILLAIRTMAARLLGTVPPTDAMQAVQARLERVRSLSALRLPFPVGLFEFATVYSAFAGPHHVATLLLAASDGINRRALVDVPDPVGPSESDWSHFIKRRLSDRPYLWTNHRQAIDSGLLNNGQSAIITFPTGAGKSTLSELKIAANVLQGRKVLYLAPTRALVSQVSRNLRDLLFEANVGEDEVEDQLFSLEATALERLVSVMTPERCLLLLTLFPESFSDLGLIVFDECHFLHMSAQSLSKRPVSAMLSLLRLLALAKDADVLLMSAMVSNGEELAGWLHDTFGRKTLTFDAAWKPTRQARGSVVFSQEELNAALSLIPAAPSRIPQKKLGARPHSLICLQQTWVSNSLEDYTLVPLVDGTTPLKGDRSPYGKPFVSLDSSACAITIALSAAMRGLKTIVFFHTPASINPGLRSALEAAGETAFEPTAEESAFIDAASIELGELNHVLLPNAIAGGHYGELLREEREVVEGAFKRSDGIRILFSTNTLAQGMNLPADLVVIVRTGSYNQDLKAYQDIEVHDLLNAAGRAGRAGYSANGLVLVIPDRIVEFNAKGQVTGSKLGHLKDAILSQDDRCLAIVDPIEVLLDSLSRSDELSEATLEYLLLRLPPSTEEEDSRATGSEFLRRSLAHYKAVRNGTEEGFERHVAEALERKASIIGSASRGTEALSSATGLPPNIIEELYQELARAVEDSPRMSAWEWCQWCLHFASQSELRQRALLRSMPAALSTTTDCVRMWITGKPYRDIELALGTPEDKLRHLPQARKFSRNFIGELAFAIGLIAQVAAETLATEHGDFVEDARTAAMLVRDGFDRPDKWALFQLMRTKLWTRVRTHNEADQWLRHVEPAERIETVAELLSRVARGVRKAEERSS